MRYPCGASDRHRRGGDTRRFPLDPKPAAGDRTAGKRDVDDDAGSTWYGADGHHITSTATVAQPSITLARSGIPDGTWLVTVQVDGVDSQPDVVGETYGEPALALT